VFFLFFSFHFSLLEFGESVLPMTVATQTDRTKPMHIHPYALYVLNQLPPRRNVLVFLSRSERSKKMNNPGSCRKRTSKYDGFPLEVRDEEDPKTGRRIAVLGNQIGRTEQSKTNRGITIPQNTSERPCAYGGTNHILYCTKLEMKSLPAVDLRTSQVELTAMQQYFSAL